MSYSIHSKGMESTTIQIPVALRNRLRRHGVAGQSYAKVIEALLDSVEHKQFMADLYAKLDEDEGTVRLADL